VLLDNHLRPYPKGLGHSTPQFGGSFLFMRTPVSQNYQIWRTTGNGLVFSGQPRLPSQGAKFQRSPIFGGSPVSCSSMFYDVTTPLRLHHASRGLSAIGEFLVHNLYSSTISSVFHIISCEALFHSFIHSFICSESQGQIRQCVTQCEPDSKAQKRTLTAAL